MPPGKTVTVQRQCEGRNSCMLLLQGFPTQCPTPQPQSHAHFVQYYSIKELHFVFRYKNGVLLLRVAQFLCWARRQCKAQQFSSLKDSCSGSVAEALLQDLVSSMASRGNDGTFVYYTVLSQPVGMGWVGWKYMFKKKKWLYIGLFRACVFCCHLSAGSLRWNAWQISFLFYDVFVILQSAFTMEFHSTCVVCLVLFFVCLFVACIFVCLFV